MLKKKSSVQISIEGHKDKNLEIPTVLIKNWKNILVGVTSLVVVLVGTIVYIAAAKQADDITIQYEATLDKEKAKIRELRQNNFNSAKDIQTAKESFNKIDSTLHAINSKMRKKGLSTIAMHNSGGPVEVDEENIELLSEYYEEALRNLDKKLSAVPIGIPHSGAITSRFGYRRNPFTNMGRELHSGIDIKGRTGDPVKTTASGVVDFAGYESGYGNVVKIKHANGYETRYAHLVRANVRRGQRVEVGRIIGLLGSTGRSTGPHLHYEVLKNNKKLNPEKYFDL